MTIQEIKRYMKANKITQITLAEKSGLPLQTLRKIFAGGTTNPRIDTMQAIEKALGIFTDSQPIESVSLTEQQRRLLNAFDSLIPPMQDYILEMTEGLVDKQQSGQVNTAKPKRA